VLLLVVSGGGDGDGEGGLKYSIKTIRIAWAKKGGAAD
jgi:hypothetical protein